jgi:hypothetical protein
VSRKTEEMEFSSPAHGRNGVLFIGRGLAYCKTEEMHLCSTAYCRNRVLFIERGLAYRKMEETDFSSSAYDRNRVLFIGRRVAYSKTGLHGILFIHRQLPPTSTCYGSSTTTSSILHQPLFIHGYCSSSLHRLLLIQPHEVLFMHPPTGWVWRTMARPPRGPVHPVATTYYHGVLFIQPPPAGVGRTSGRQQRELFIHSQPTG